MNNKLFVVCPFSCMENFISSKYEGNIFFITAMATIFQYRESNCLEIIKQLVIREKIVDIYLVSDTSCRFINNALNRALNYGSYPEFIIQKLVTDNYAALDTNKTKYEQQVKLAELIVKHQARELNNLHYLQPFMENKISIKALITTKKLDKVIEQLELETMVPT